MKTENCCTGCNRPDLPWAGRGTELPIAGCRFTLYPMSDKYIEIILGVLNREGEAPNAELVKDIHFPVHCKLALYPLGDAQYIDEIAKVWYMAQEEGLNPKTIHYATRIDGDVQDVFTYLTHVCELMENAPAVHHYVLHFTMNCNSPTEEN